MTLEERQAQLRDLDRRMISTENSAEWAKLLGEVNNARQAYEAARRAARTTALQTLAPSLRALSADELYALDLSLTPEERALAGL